MQSTLTKNLYSEKSKSESYEEFKKRIANLSYEEYEQAVKEWCKENDY